MNGFAAHGLDEDAFGEKNGLSSGIRSFDAFRMYFLDNLTKSILNPKPSPTISVALLEGIERYQVDSLS